MRQYFNHFGHCTVQTRKGGNEKRKREIAKCLYILLLKCHKVYSLIEHFENFFFVRCVLMRECAQFQSVIYTFRCVPYNTNCIHYLFSLLKLLLFSRFFGFFSFKNFVCFSISEYMNMKGGLNESLKNWERISREFTSQQWLLLSKLYYTPCQNM